MIDVHSHILPGMDDGSKSCEESISMLSKLKEQGVDTVVASSHFYADQEMLDRFLHRRERSYRRLQEAMEEAETPLPKVILGAEVWYFEGISHSDSLKPLCAEGTDIFLLEMPFSRWTEHMLNEIVSLREENDFAVLLAHVERYLKWQKKSTWDWLSQQNILMQTNAEAYMERRTAKKVLKMLDNRQVQLLGTDCHNLTSRPPNYGEALRKIRDALGDAAIEYLSGMERMLYRQGEGAI